MTRYLLDTNIISDLVRNPRGAAARRIGEVGEGSVCTSVIVAAELRYGCAKNGSRRLTTAVEEILGEIAVLPFEAPADAEYGRLRAELEAAGLTIGGNDLLLASHACMLGATVVTANMREFARVTSLRVENWLA